MTDLLVRRHNLPFPRAPEIQPRDLAFRQYAHEFHRESYWIAEDGTRKVGYALATRNDGRWLLNGLHVIPEYQGRGIGRRFLDLTLSSAKPSDILCVRTDSIQPVSNAHYIQAGMLPWVPVLTWAGPIAGPVPDLPVTHLSTSGLTLRNWTRRPEGYRPAPEEGASVLAGPTWTAVWDTLGRRQTGRLRIRLQGRPDRPSGGNGGAVDADPSALGRIKVKGAGRRPPVPEHPWAVSQRTGGRPRASTQAPSPLGGPSLFSTPVAGGPVSDLGGRPVAVKGYGYRANSQRSLGPFRN